jgi:hypothetical protein
VLYSLDGSHLACAADGTRKQTFGTTTIVDAVTGARVQTFDGQPIGFAPDGQTLLVRSDDELAAWDYLKGQKVRSLGKRTMARRTRFLPNPTRVVLQHETELVILDYATGKVQDRISMPAKGSLYHSDFVATPDGRTVAQLVFTKKPESSIADGAPFGKPQAE